MKWIKFAEGKSGKREVAISLFLMWAFAYAYVFYWIEPELIEKYERVLDGLTLAVFTFGAGAFGLDFAAKKGWLGGSQPPPMMPPRGDQRYDREMGP
jgi:hypothetical protein